MGITQYYITLGKDHHLKLVLTSAIVLRMCIFVDFTILYHIFLIRTSLFRSLEQIIMSGVVIGGVVLDVSSTFTNDIQLNILSNLMHHSS